MRKIRVPNRIINEETLSFSARRLAAYFCAGANRLGRCQKSLSMLSGLSGLSPATVRAAIGELERAGFLTRQRKYRYDADHGYLVYDRTVYQVNKYLPGGFTLVPADLFQKRGLSSGAFVVALYLCQQGAGQGRAFPSIRQIMETVGAAKSTVCRALQQLRAAAVFLVRRCVRNNATFAANSYFFLRRVEPMPRCEPAPEAERRSHPSLLDALRQFYHWLARKINGLGCPIFSKPVIGLR